MSELGGGNPLVESGLPQLYLFGQVFGLLGFGGGALVNPRSGSRFYRFALIPKPRGAY